MAIAYTPTTLAAYGAQENIRVKQMTSTRFMALYTDPDTSLDTYLRMFDVSGNTITLIGTETVCLDYDPSSEESTWIDMAFEDGSSGVVIWCQTGSDDVYAKAISISGTTINVGSATLVEAGTFGRCAVSKATSTAGRYLAAYNHRAVVLDVSGTSVTVRTPANFDANTASRAVGSGQSGENVVIGYYKSTTFYAQVISSITTSFSTNTIYQISTTNYADDGQTCNILNGLGIACYYNIGDSYYLNTFAVSSTVITAGTEVSSDGTPSNASNGGIVLDSTAALLGSNAGGSNLEGTVYDVDVDNSNTISGADILDTSSSAGEFFWAYYTTGKAVLLWNWSDGVDSELRLVVVESELISQPQAKFFFADIGAALQQKFTMPFAGAAPKAMTLRESLGTVVIGGNSAASSILVYSDYPYPTGTAGDSGLPTGSAISAVRWI